jgi:WD40 repeat protein
MVRERERLHRLVVDGLHDLVTIELECGEFKSGIAHATRLLELDPLMEVAHRQMMNLLAVSGQRGAALAQYETCSELLEKELGAEPSRETQETYELLLKGDRPPGIPSVPAAHEVEILRVGECPYRGLAAFREEDAAYFYGREGFTEMLGERIHKWPLVAVIVGSSGSGKSSAVYAGLLPKLREDGDWLVSDFRPGAAPIRAISNALLPLLEPDIKETDRLIQAFKLEQALGEGELTISDVICQVIEREQQDKRVLLVVDQFEELYTLCPDSQLQQRFMDELLRAVETAGQRRDGCFVALLTMRADFMGQALAYRPFADALQDGSLLMGPMNREEMRAAIEKPAEMQGVGFESGLVERILDDVGGEPGNLPLLEFALTLLWEKENFGWLTHAAYEEIGRVEGALASYADQVYEGLKPGEGERARHVFVQLVRPGKGTEDTRRVARRDELGNENWELVQHLADKRLVVTGRDDSGQETAEVVHEALIQRWGLLRQWMEADREFRSWQERLRSNMRQWEESGRDEGVLLRGAPLAAAEEWSFERADDLSPGEVEYIQASQELQERRIAVREIRRRRTVLALTGGLVLALVLALLAGLQWRRADVAGELALSRQHVAETAQAQEGALRVEAQEARNMAEEAEKETFSRELAAHAINNMEVDPERSILLALHALLEVEHTADAEHALHQSLVRHHIIKTLKGHTKLLLAMALSPDGKTLVSGGFDDYILFWDTDTGEQLPITFPENTVIMGAAFAFSPDGESLAVSDFFGGDVTIWRLPIDRTGLSQKLLTMSGSNNICSALTFSPRGDQLACSQAFDGTVRVWDTESGRSLHEIKGHETVPETNYSLTGATGVVYSPDGSRLYSTGADGKIVVWDVKSGQELGRGSADAAIYSLALTPDGSLLATSDANGLVKIWNISDGHQLDLKLSVNEKGTRALRFNPTGDRVVTGGTDGTTRLWDLATGKLLISFPGHSGFVQQVAFNHDGTRIYTVGQDMTVKVWDSRPGYEVALLPGGKPAFSPDGDKLALGHFDGSITILDGTTFQNLFVLKGHNDLIVNLEFSRDGRFLASSSYDSTGKVWDVQKGQLLFTLNHADNVYSIVISPDQKYIATASKDGSIVLWDSTYGDTIYTLLEPESTYNPIDPDYITFSPDGNRLLALHDDKIKIWDINDGTIVTELEYTGTNAIHLAYRPDGKHLAICGEGIAVQVYDMTTEPFQHEYNLTGVGGNAFWCSYNQDSTLLATTGRENTTIVWDAQSGEERLRLTNVGDDSAFHPSFSPDGKYLTVGGYYFSQVYSLQLDDLLTRAQDRLRRKNFTEEECRQFLHMDACPEIGEIQE